MVAAEDLGFNWRPQSYHDPPALTAAGALYELIAARTPKRNKNRANDKLYFKVVISLREMSALALPAPSAFQITKTLPGRLASVSIKIRQRRG
jgi:hypothetical protein